MFQLRRRRGERRRVALPRSAIERSRRAKRRLGVSQRLLRATELRQKPRVVQFVRLKRAQHVLWVGQPRGVFEELRALNRVGRRVRSRKPTVVRAHQTHARRRMKRRRRSAGEDVRDVRGGDGAATGPKRVAQGGEHLAIARRAVRR